MGGAAATTAFQPPTACQAHGKATAKPATRTTTCTMFTHAEVRSPPAVKYAVTTIPPMSTPAQCGVPATKLRILAIAMSWAARSAGVPIHRSPVIVARTEDPYRNSR